MKFWVASSLYYYVGEESTILCSLSCDKKHGQTIIEESLSTSREAGTSELSVGLGANRFTRFEVDEPGEFNIRYAATVETSFSKVKTETLKSAAGNRVDSEAIPYLFPSRYAPADRMRATATDLFGGLKCRVGQALAVEDWLFKSLVYQPGSSDEQSTAVHTMETRSGVCRDFAHLGIALCRALTIPARYLTVYAYGLVPQDFHAVFEVFIDGRWFVLDGTRKAPLNGMVRIATGQDASDVAVASLFGNITGQGVNVQSEIANTETRPFSPLTRQELRDKGELLSLD